MKLKSFGFGSLIPLAILIYGFLSKDWETSVKVIAFSGLIPMIIAGILSGAFVSRDGHTTTYKTGVKEEEASKSRWSIAFLMFSLPNAVTLIIIVLLAMMTG